MLHQWYYLVVIAKWKQDYKIKAVIQTIAVARVEFQLFCMLMSNKQISPPSLVLKLWSFA